MAFAGITSSTVGNSLQSLLLCDEIVPGSDPSYQTCKTIYAYHPLGAKMAEAPLELAQSQERTISVPTGPEERVKEAFQEEWKKIGADKHIFNTMKLARVYGIASIAMLCEEVESTLPIDPWKLPDLDIAFNVFDPLNTSGSLVLNQNPNAIDFQKTTTIAVQGKTYHRSRSRVVLNEEPVYIQYTSSAFGYVGRSVYQRALFPIRSFIATMITDDMVALKAGLLIAKMEQPGSIIDRTMQYMAGVKRSLLKEAQVNNVLTVGREDVIETLNLQNLDGAFGNSRKNILKNIATACPMPAILLENETLTEGFGEGTEDAKTVARYVDRVRVQMATLYDYFDQIVQHRAWNKKFYQTIQAEYAEYKGVPYEAAFYRWANSFKAVWPNLLKEPDSEAVKTEDVKLKALIATLEVLLPDMDPENRATVIEWFADNVNSNKLMFTTPLILDMDALREYEPPEQMQQQEPAPPFSGRDSAGGGSGNIRQLMTQRRADRIAAYLKQTAPDIVMLKEKHGLVRA